MEVDYYHLLGITPNATRKEIRIAYRRMAEVYHPDKLIHLPPSVRGEGENIMRLLNEAKSVLLDPEHRRHYDERTGNTDFKENAIIVQEYDQAKSYEREYFIALEKEEVSSMMARVLSGLREVFIRDKDFQNKIAVAQEIVEARIIEEGDEANDAGIEPHGKESSAAGPEGTENEVEMTLEFTRVKGEESNGVSRPGPRTGKKGFRIVAIEGDEENEEVEWEEEE